MSDERERGREWFERVMGMPAPAAPPDPFVEATVDHLFANVWARPGLSLRDRRLATLVVLIQLGNESVLRLHLPPPCANSSSATSRSTSSFCTSPITAAGRGSGGQPDRPPVARRARRAAGRRRLMDGQGSSAMIDDDMRALIAAQRLCYAATVAADGRPNLSPKGTIGSGTTPPLLLRIASPGTRANLAANPWIELNVVDPLSRRGYRFRGTATVHAGDAVYRDALTRLAAEERVSYAVHAMVLVRVERALWRSRRPGYASGSRRGRHARAVARPAGGPRGAVRAAPARRAGRGGRSGPAEGAHGALRSPAAASCSPSSGST